MDQRFMRAALALARRSLGSTWPNPPVGCVLVRDGRIVGQGRTAAGGRPHAETEALSMAGAAARGATAYVTLEPCSHHGRTPPCADALVVAGVARVVVAAGDPDPRVNGAGLARLRAAGLSVTEEVLAAEAEEVLAGFFGRIRMGRPLITLKLAGTLDGRIATSSGESQWITSVAARRAAHALRGQHDAVAVGVGTVLADDPDLTCRLPGYAPWGMAPRIVFDTHLQTPLTARLVATSGEIPSWILFGQGADPARLAALEGAGVRCLRVGRSEEGLDVAEAVAVLAETGLTRVLVEGGSKLAASLLRAGLVDRLAWFQASAVMGGDGLPAVQGMGVMRLDEMPRFRRLAERPVGPDLWLQLTRL